MLDADEGNFTKIGNSMKQNPADQFYSFHLGLAIKCPTLVKVHLLNFFIAQRFKTSTAANPTPILSVSNKISSWLNPVFILVNLWRQDTCWGRWIDRGFSPGTSLYFSRVYFPRIQVLINHIRDWKLIAIKIAKTAIVTTASIISESGASPRRIIQWIDQFSKLPNSNHVQNRELEFGVVQLEFGRAEWEDGETEHGKNPVSFD